MGKNKLISDAYVAGIGYMQKHEIWKVAVNS